MLEEAVAELNAREAHRAQRAHTKAVERAGVTTKRLMGEATRRVAAEVKGTADAKTALRRIRSQIYRRVINDAVGMSTDLKNKLRALDKGDFKTDVALIKAVQEAVQQVRIAHHKGAKKDLSAALNTRKRTPDIAPHLDNVLTALIRVLKPKRAKSMGFEKGMELEAALDAYVAERGPHVKPMVDLVKRVIKKNVDVDSMDPLTVDFLASFAESMGAQNKILQGYKHAKKVYEDDLVVAETLENILAEHGLASADLKTDKLGNLKRVPEWAEKLRSVTGQFTYGIEATARLTDAVEYITGSNNTVAHKVMVKDVIEGVTNAASAHRAAHMMAYEITAKHGLTNKDLWDTSVSNKKNTKKNTIEVDGAGTIHRGNLIQYLMQAKDPTTLNKLTGGKNNIWFNPKGRKATEWSGEKHDALMAHVRREYQREMKIAELLVEIHNHKSLVDPLRMWGLEVHGKDIIRPGEAYVPSETKGGFNARKEESKSEVSLADLELDTGVRGRELGEINESFTKTKVEKHSRDLVMRDAVESTTNYLRAVTTLVNLQPALKRAIGLAKDPNLKAATKEGSVTRTLLNGLVNNYYHPIITQRSGLKVQASKLGADVRWMRNKAVGAMLWGLITVPLYQPLSEFAAGSYLGKHGMRHMFRANKELGLGRWGRANRESTQERMLESGLAWERWMQSTSIALVQGQATGGKAGGLSFGNEQFGTAKRKSMIARSDQHAILRIFRATELKVEEIFKAKGIKVDYESAVFKKVVERMFNDVVIETQPMYEAAVQPAIINRKDDVIPTLFTMFRGYTAKLAAIQRISVTRATRALERGDIKEANQIMREMAEQTLVGSGMVAIIRKLVKSGIRVGAGAAVGSLPDEPTQEEINEYGMEAMRDVFLQMSGITVGGGIAAQFTLPPVMGIKTHTPSVSPLMDSFKSAFEGTHAVVSGSTSPKQYMKALQGATTPFGVPAALWQYPRYLMDALEEAKKAEIELMMGTNE